MEIFYIYWTDIFVLSKEYFFYMERTRRCGAIEY